MRVTIEDILSIKFDLDFSNFFTEKIPSKEELYNPFKNIFTELNLFEFLKNGDYSLKLTMKEFSSSKVYNLIKGIVEEAPELILSSDSDDIAITVSLGKLILMLKLFVETEFIEEEKDEKEEKEEKEEKRTLVALKEDLNKITNDLQLLLGTLYSQDLLKKGNVEVPTEISSIYIIEETELKEILKLLSKKLAISSKLGTALIDGINIKFMIDKKKWSAITISKETNLLPSARKRKVRLKLTHSDIFSLKEINVLKIIDMNIAQTNIFLSEIIGDSVNIESKE